VRPEEFLVAAERLLDDPSGEEGCLRSAAHASYYAVYHLAASHFHLDPTNRGEAKHADVMALLDGAQLMRLPRGIREAKRLYRRLWALRTKADYRLAETFDQAEAERALEYAKAVFAQT